MARMPPREALSLRPKTGQIQGSQRQTTDKLADVQFRVTAKSR